MIHLEIFMWVDRKKEKKKEKHAWDKTRIKEGYYT